MKIVTNSKLISRNAKIGSYTAFVAMAILLISTYIVFTKQNYFIYSFLGLLIGLILFQISTYFSNRWGRNPRPDQVIDKSLKGMGREYTIYHFTTPVSHLLVGPAGVWTISPYYQVGTVTYNNKRWRIKGGGFMQSYLRLFGAENIGRPDLEAEGEIDSARKYLTKVLPEGTEIPPVRAALLFVHPQVQLDVDGAPLPALTPKDIKDFLKEESKSKPITATTLDLIRQALPQPNKEEE